MTDYTLKRPIPRTHPVANHKLTHLIKHISRLGTEHARATAFKQIYPKSIQKKIIFSALQI